MGTVSNPTPVTGQVWWDGSHLQMNIGGTTYQLDHPKVGSLYTVSNISANHTFNGSTATLGVVINTLGTLLQDLQSSNL